MGLSLRYSVLPLPKGPCLTNSGYRNGLLSNRGPVRRLSQPSDRSTILSNDDVAPWRAPTRRGKANKNKVHFHRRAGERRPRSASSNPCRRADTQHLPRPALPDGRPAPPLSPCPATVLPSTAPEQCRPRAAFPLPPLPPVAGHLPRAPRREAVALRRDAAEWHHATHRRQAVVHASKQLRSSRLRRRRTIAASPNQPSPPTSSCSLHICKCNGTAVSCVDPAARAMTGCASF